MSLRSGLTPTVGSFRGGAGGVHISSQADESLGRYLDTVKKHGGFAADVAASVSKTQRFGIGGGKVALMSSKQAWVLAKAGIDHAIPTHGTFFKAKKVKWATSSGNKKSKTYYDFIPLVPLKG